MEKVTVAMFKMIIFNRVRLEWGRTFWDFKIKKIICIKVTKNDGLYNWPQNRPE